MELHYGIKQPFRFYEKLEHQNRFRKGGDVKVFSLLMPTDYLLPFQIKRMAGAILPLQSIKAVPTNGDPDIELIGNINFGDLKTYPFPSYDYLVHLGLQPLSSPLPVGEYYFIATDNVDTWYSEVVTVKNFDPLDLSTNDCALTKITYWDTCDVADIFYRGVASGDPQYKNIIYLDIDVGKPEYEYTEEGEEDGEGRFFAELKRLEKQYQLQGVFPEFVVDALSLLPLHVGRTGAIEVLTQRGYTGSVDRITVNPNWQGDSGVWALTDLAFSTEFVVKTNCCGDIEEPINLCLREPFEVVCELLEGSPDALNFEYTSAANGSKIPLQNGDLILYELLSGVKLVRMYNAAGGTYDGTFNIWTLGDGLVDLNQLNGLLLNPPYYFWGGSGAIGFLDAPTISSLSEDIATGKTKVEGTTWSDAILQVRVNTGGIGTDLVATVTGAQYNASGALFDIPNGAIDVFVRAVGLTCNLGDSDSVDFEGIGTMVIGTDFTIT